LALGFYVLVSVIMCIVLSYFILYGLLSQINLDDDDDDGGGGGGHDESNCERDSKTYV